MKLLSFRNLMILAVVALLVANILWRLPAALGWNTVATIDSKDIWGSANIMPTVSNLSAMGKQWEERLKSMSPEERKKSKERLAGETRFFVQAQFLPAEERRVKVRERIEMLMNDREIQAEWAGERMRMLAGLTPGKRHEIMKAYVQSKKERSAP
jgi:hypothetical protein